MVKTKDKLFLYIAWLLSLLLFFYAVDNIWKNYLSLQDTIRVFGITQSAISLFVFRSYLFLFFLSVPLLALLLYNKQRKFHLSFKIFSVIVLLNAIQLLLNAIYSLYIYTTETVLSYMILFFYSLCNMIFQPVIMLPLSFIISVWFYIKSMDTLLKNYGIPKILTLILIILAVLSISSILTMVNY